MRGDLSREWVEKAEQDYRAAAALLRLRRSPPYDVVCFECQQCAEKYLKGWMCLVGMGFPKTHDLDLLAKMAMERDGSFELISDLCRLLVGYAVGFRYPGDESDRKEAARAMAAVKEIRDFVRTKITKIKVAK